MSYTQNAPYYDAQQWTSSRTIADFTTAINSPITGWSENPDGSLTLSEPLLGTFTIPLNAWIVSAPTWQGTAVCNFLSSNLNSPSGNPYFTDSEFAAQFTVKP
jgi:hypothetical protein